MGTPLVYVEVLYAMAVHVPSAVLVGAGFGLGRSRPLVDGFVARGRLAPPQAAERFVHLKPSDRILGCCIAAVAVAGLLILAQ